MPPFRLAAAALACLVPLTAAAAERGAEVFASTCSTCHLETLSADAVDQAKDLKAPPMNLLSTLIRKKVGNSEPAFIAHVMEFTVRPAKEKVKAMPAAVEEFGLMPPIGDTAPNLTEGDLRAVAGWLYDHYDYEAELRELQEHARSGRAPGGH